MTELRSMAILGLASLALASCATTNVVQVWRDPNYAPAPVKRVMVVGVVPHAGERVTFENAIAQALLKKDFEVATSSGVVPPGRSVGETVDSYAREMGVDLVVVVRLVTAYGAWYGAVDINVYAVRTGSEVPVWSGTSMTENFNSAQDAADSMAASLVYRLVNARILVR